MTKRTLIILLLALCVSPLRAGEITSVTLLSTVRLAGDDTLTLGDIAEIVGPQHRELAPLPIDSLVTIGSWTRVGVEQVREMLDDAQRVAIGSIVVKGNESFITRRPTRLNADTIKSGTAANSDAKDQPPVPTLHDSVMRWIAKRYGVQSKDLRLELRDADREALAMSAEDRLVEIHQIGNANRLTLRLTVYAGERIERSFTIAAKLEIRRQILVVTERINRGTEIDKSMYVVQTQWVKPNTTPANAETIDGLVARSALRAGTVIMYDDIETPIVINRGDIISARSIAGSVVVNLRARALSSVRDGELLELESLDRKSRFTARASGLGRAVIISESNQ